MITVLMAIGYVMQELILKIRTKADRKPADLAELQLLKSQISPHFLFNVLTVLCIIAENIHETPDVI
ncbi:histidine kinase [Myroides ceti]|uniref:Histidine kinase n=1 Tax=Paenimyroides ceti TaxID=395087 RepID=A0ABT8D1H4_9FLAO|nr:histidine kinase [Paenimyroides ceti]MDN3710216.1 histidine kinase [Paenimyroides ceti]